MLLSLTIEYVSGNMNIDSPERRAKLAWHRASENQLHQYRRNLDNVMSNIKVLDELINCDGKTCDGDRYMYYIGSLGCDIVQSCFSVAQTAIPKCTVKRGIQKWTEMSKPAHDTMTQWFATVFG